MFDTVRFYVPVVPDNTAVQNIVNGLDWCKEGTGKTLLYGNCINMRVALFTDKSLFVTGSISKFTLGSNIYTPTREQIMEGVESLSDRLSIDFNSAKVTRLDVSTVIETEHQPQLYYNSLGTKQYFERMTVTDNTLLYHTKGRQLMFYDKRKEIEDKGGTVPKNYEGCNLLRYEMRLLKSPYRQLRLKSVTGKDLYDKDFYNKAVQMWCSEFESITKLNKATMKPAKETMTVTEVRNLFLAKTIQDCRKMEDIEYFIQECKEQKMFPDPKYYTRLKASLYSYFNTPTNEGNGYAEELERKVREVASRAV